MDKNFIPYEESVALEALGFNEPCFAGYSILTEKIEFYSKPLLTRDSFTVDAPTYSQAFRWFREKYGLFVSPNVISYEDGPYLWFFEINSTVLPFGTDLGETDDYKTYEEAEIACLRKLIEIVKTHE
jgi:hypothetical protein